MGVASVSCLKVVARELCLCNNRYMPNLSPNLDKVLAAVGKGARGVHQSQLDAKTLASLRGFMAFLISEGKSEGTARVYKSLAAKAAAEGVDTGNAMMMSALRALQRYANSK